MFARTAVEFHPLFRLIQQEQQFMRFKPADSQQIPVREGEPACRITACGWSFG
jgi:hypothetical protein